MKNHTIWFVSSIPSFTEKLSSFRSGLRSKKNGLLSVEYSIKMAKILRFNNGHEVDIKVLDLPKTEKSSGQLVSMVKIRQSISWFKKRTSL